MKGFWHGGVVALSILLAAPLAFAAIDINADKGFAAPKPAEAVAPVTPALVAPDVPKAQTLEEQVAPVKVFGEWLFRGRFASESFKGFNPNYLVSIGDTINLKLWGAYDFDAALSVDAQGNIFIPKIGPVAVLNVRNGDLNTVVSGRVKAIYRDNVGVYAGLSDAQPVKIFVSGFVRAPGLFNGSASDSVLQFIDRAGGITPTAGSFLDIRVVRAGSTVHHVNLYDFLIDGKMPMVQFRDGDTVIVESIKNTVAFTGLVANPYQIEFMGDSLPLSEALSIAGPVANATHALVTRNRGLERTVEYVALTDAGQVMLHGGDAVDIVADKSLKTIAVMVEGEHLGRAQYVVPYGATLGDVLAKVERAPQSDLTGVQLFREGLAVRQKQMIEESLRALENSVFGARSGTLETAQLRVKEAELINQFIERARLVQPKGQVVLSSSDNSNAVTLEDGDRIRIPRKSQLVAVHGEVYFPSAFLFNRKSGPDDYIGLAGGYTQKASKARVLVMRPSGQIEIFRDGRSTNRLGVAAGDEILVLPNPDEKTFQFTKDMVQIIFQIALATGVVLGL